MKIPKDLRVPVILLLSALIMIHIIIFAIGCRITDLKLDVKDASFIPNRVKEVSPP